MALYNFTPGSKEDSIVLNILKTGRLTLEMGHMELARYYESIKDYEKAFRENEALVYTVPRLDLFYEPALNILLTTQQYKRALLLMDDGLKYNKSGFIYKWVGQLHLACGDVQEGILILEKARNLLPRDPLLLFNLTRAYFSTSQFEKGDAILQKLKETEINPAAIKELESIRNQSDRKK